MKKSMLFIAILLSGMFASAQLLNKYTAGLGFSTDLEKIGPTLKFDYHLNKKMGVGLRTHYVIGTWQDYINQLTAPYAPYNLIVDYQKGNQMAFSIDAIYHIIGNNQESKFGMRIEAGLGYHGWSQTLNAKTDAPISDPAFYNYNKTFGMRAFSLKTGIGFEYQAGPGKLFLDIPVHIDIYGTEFYNYSNQIWNSASNLTNTKETKFRLDDSPDSFIKFNIGYQIPFSKSKSKEISKSATACPVNVH